MKVVCEAKIFKEAIGIAEHNTSKNQSLPILQSIYLEAKGNILFIRATNLENALEISLPAKVDHHGSIAVSGKILNSFLSHIHDSHVTLQNKQNNLFIKTSQTETTLRGYAQEDFPLFPSIESLFSFILSSQEFNIHLRRVLIAVSSSDIKPELASVSWYAFKNKLKLAATDSFRLSESSLVSKSLNVSSVLSFLLPSLASYEILRLVENSSRESLVSFGDEKEIKIFGNKNQIVFQNKTIRFISRLTEGIFPDYEQIIPKSFLTEVVVKQDSFLQQLKLASVFMGRLNDIQLIVDSSKKNITLKAINSDVGEHISSLDASIQGEDVTAKFNWRYLIDGVQQINTEYIVLGMNNEQSPLLLKGKGDTSYFYLAMPMRGI